MTSAVRPTAHDTDAHSCPAGRLPPTSSAPERTGPADGSFGAESDGEETLPLQRAQSIVRAKLQSEGWRVGGCCACCAALHHDIGTLRRVACAPAAFEPCCSGQTGGAWEYGPKCCKTCMLYVFHHH